MTDRRPWQLDITVHDDSAGQDDRHDRPRQHTIETCSVGRNGGFIGDHERMQDDGGYFCSICGRIYWTGDEAEYGFCRHCYHRESYATREPFIKICIIPAFMDGTLPEFVERMNAEQDPDIGSWRLDTSDPDIWGLTIDCREA